MPLEELHFLLVLLRSFARVEGTEILSLAGLGIFLFRIKAILA